MIAESGDYVIVQGLCLSRDRAPHRAYPRDLFAEEIGPSGEQLGNFPQTFPPRPDHHRHGPRRLGLSGGSCDRRGWGRWHEHGAGRLNA